MTTYELTYIISPEMTSEEADSKAKEIESAIQKNEGVIVKQQNPVPKTLSIQVNGHASGFFGVIEFQLEPENISAITTFIQADKKISRHMLLVKKPARIKKGRRAKKEEVPTFTIESKTEEKVAPETTEKSEEPTEDKKPAEGKGKVELKDIEQQLEEILGE